MKVIAGTDAIKTSVRRVVTDMHQEISHLKGGKYSVSLNAKKNGGLFKINKENGKLTNESKLVVPVAFRKDVIYASIDNVSGDILVIEKPIYVSEKTVLKRVENFLSELINKNKKHPVKSESDLLESNGFVFKKSLTRFDKYKVSEEIEGHI